MFPIVNPSQVADDQEAASGSQHDSEGRGTKRKRSAEIEWSECYLLSVRELRENVQKSKHKCAHISAHYSSKRPFTSYSVLSEIIQNHIFVGIVDASRCLSLIQHSTKLYLVNHGVLS